MIERYPLKYRSMQQRFLYIIFSRYGTLSKMGKMLNVSKQYITRILKTGNIPLEYASFLSSKTQLPTALFDYNTYVQVKGSNALTYEKLLKNEKDWFDDVEYNYILDGVDMSDPVKLLSLIWKKALKPSERKEK